MVYVVPSLSAIQRIPNELWFKILGQLPPPNLASVTLTSRVLNSVSRTLQFQAFTFHPYKVDSLVVLSPSDHDINTTTRRLEFWTSATIAPLVRQIAISPCQVGRPVRDFSTDTDPDDVRYILLNIFFERLRHFVNLQKLDCYQLDFPKSALQNLCQLPLLKELVIERCGISASDAPSGLLRLAHLEYIDAFSSCDRLIASGVHRWLPFLDPSWLQSLRLTSARVATVFFRDISAMAVMSSLHTLDIGLLVAPLQQMASILSKIPALRTLRLSLLGVPDSHHCKQVLNTPSPPPLDIPFPLQYYGPYETLHLFQPGRPRYLELYGFDGHAGNCCNAASLLETLRPLQDSVKHVELLNLSLRDVSETTFSALCSLFVGVKSLHLFVNKTDQSELSFNAYLRLDDPSVEVGFVKNKIFAEFPALRCLWLQCGRRFEMFWIRPEDGGPEILEERNGPLDYRRRNNLLRAFGEYSDAM